MDHVATGASPVPPKRSKAEPTQPPNSYRENLCHSDAARSAKEESAVLRPRNSSRQRINEEYDASAYTLSSETVLKTLIDSRAYCKLPTTLGELSLCPLYSYECQNIQLP